MKTLPAAELHRVGADDASNRVTGDMLDTVVSFTLTPTASGTRLSLVQSGFKPDQKKNFGGARYGWKMMGGKLVDLLGRIS